MNTQDTKIKNLLAQHGIKYAPVFTHTKNEKDWPRDVFAIIFTNKKEAECFEYGQGLGHRNQHGIPKTPTAASVLHCLLLDSEACDESFESWANCFGYDPDSMKALKIYNACKENGEKLNRIFTPGLLAEMQKVLQDY
jgi:hypothetical protein